MELRVATTVASPPAVSRTFRLRTNSALLSYYFKMKRRSDDSKKSRTAWSAQEDEALLKAVLEDQQDRQAEGATEEEEDWDEIAKAVPGKTPVQCLKRYMFLNTKQGRAEAAGPDIESSAAESLIASQPPGAGASAATSTAATAGTSSAPSQPSTPFKQEDEEADEDEEDDDNDDETGGKGSKRSRTEGDALTRWSQDEEELLKKLVEQYSDGE